MIDLAVVAEGLTKRYGTVTVLDGVDLHVPAGTVLGLLGRNGAGKTTTVRILSTLLRPDGGHAEVAGFDVRRQGARVRSRIGLVGQHAAVDEILSGRRNLVMFGRLHGLSTAAARRRADQLLDRFDLLDVAGKPVAKYSGGMRRRLDLAASLILAPPVLFLDEPTTGLDPHGRAEVWSAVRGLVAGGTTVLLTTQHLDEADQLADRIAVIDGGRVIAEGSPEALKSGLGGDRLHLMLRDAGDLAATATLISGITGTPTTVDVDTRSISAPAPDRVRALAESVRALHDAGIEVADLAVRRPTLDEVFLQLTGDAVRTSDGKGVAA